MVEKVFRISTIIKDYSGYCFVSNDEVVLTVEYKKVFADIPELPKQMFTWQQPILRVYQNSQGEIISATLDGRLIYAITEKQPKLSPIERFVLNYPENNKLCADIKSLPPLYRPGLLILLYTKLFQQEHRRYLSLLVWLNQIAASVYNRHSPDKIDRASKWKKLNLSKEDIQKICANTTVLHQSEKTIKDFIISDCLELLGVKDFNVLNDEEQEIISLFITYILQINDAICDDRDLIYVNIVAICNIEHKKYDGNDEETVRHFLNYKLGLKTYSVQDMLKKTFITEDDIAYAQRIYFID